MNKKKEVLRELEEGKYNFGCSLCFKNFADKKIVDFEKHLKTSHPKEWEEMQQKTWRDILIKGDYPASKLKHLLLEWKR